ncbi:hypothetical protein Fot_13174 [Forsythia ovata]|uniref:Uncharacterized protein n=1 Tax=Forsythia ovata TaxID=205694 RepID=A0ABD1W2T7_9LAMI
MVVWEKKFVDNLYLYFLQIHGYQQPQAKLVTPPYVPLLNLPRYPRVQNSCDGCVTAPTQFRITSSTQQIRGQITKITVIQKAITVAQSSLHNNGEPMVHPTKKKKMSRWR